MPDEVPDRVQPDKPPNYEDTSDPALPPEVITSATTRRRVFWAYMGPVIAFFLAIAVVLVYWLNRPPSRPSLEQDARPIGTSGVTGYPGPTAGGSDPRPPFDSTKDELRSRGIADER